MNFAKMTIFVVTHHHLGHTLSSDGVTPGNSKIEAIQKLAQPKNTKQLKSFLGLANYFCQYINSFSQVAAPLFKLTRKDAHWPALEKTFPDDVLKAFNDLKACLLYTSPSPRDRG